MKTIKIRLNKDLHGYKAGQILTLSNIQKGIKLDKYWMKRITDSKFDNCLEIISKKKKNSDKQEDIKNKGKKADIDFIKIKNEV